MTTFPGTDDNEIDLSFIYSVRDCQPLYKETVIPSFYSVLVVRLPDSHTFMKSMETDPHWSHAIFEYLGWDTIASYHVHPVAAGCIIFLYYQYTGTHFVNLRRMTGESTPPDVNSMADRGSNSRS